MAAIVLAVLWLEQKHCNLHERMVELPLFQSRAECLVNQLHMQLQVWPGVHRQLLQDASVGVLGRDRALQRHKPPKPMKCEILPPPKAGEM